MDFEALPQKSKVSTERCEEMVARGKGAAERSTPPLDHPPKRGSPERAKTRGSARFLPGLSGLKHYSIRSRGCASLAPGYLISAPSALYFGLEAKRNN